MVEDNVLGRQGEACRMSVVYYAPSGPCSTAVVPTSLCCTLRAAETAR